MKTPRKLTQCAGRLNIAEGLDQDLGSEKHPHINRDMDFRNMSRAQLDEWIYGLPRDWR